ncbi:cytochrome P450 [Ganoderma sinense ZZ0214-1]|uniref:Cytochrome P450 n=1 Tax=Ganoderma sinense ZZ0214-1 TaxID=1077348 RepID=A0A2G8RMJ0_9APHY|nr:cytochrome P450 [Ganoderma sinense ZZ0214-1]
MNGTLILTLLSAALGYLLISLCLKFYKGATRFRSRHLPPGPPPLPITGNLFDIPKTRPWIGYRELSNEYGNLMLFRIFNQCLVIVNDAETAVDLLEKRSAKYSSRPSSVLTKLAGWEWNMAFFPYGWSWRHHRRVVWKHYQPDAIPRYYDAQTQAARRLLALFISTPHNISENIRYGVGAAIVTTTYGLDVGGDLSDKYLSAFETGVKSIQLFLSGTSILEFLPTLSYIPPWVPGAGYLRKLVEIRRATLRLRDLPWRDARDAVLSGRANGRESVVRAMMEDYACVKDKARYSFEEEAAKNVAAVSYAGTVFLLLEPFSGIDTTHGVLCNFCVAMSLYPEVQKKAQAELDAVIGQHRFPEFSDRENLPYINAIVKEIFRWNPVTPLGLARLTTSDDHYNGYFIPGGSIVMVNTWYVHSVPYTATSDPILVAWSILNDPQVYPDPDKFIPQRFLKDGKLNPAIRDPVAYLFGFGRRLRPCSIRSISDRLSTITVYQFTLSRGVVADWYRISKTVAARYRLGLQRQKP